jgi:hypothetical protein
VDALFIVGNGTGTFDSQRSNAFVVKKDGTGYLSDKKVATEGGTVVATYWNTVTGAPKLQSNGVYLIRTGHNDSLYNYITESELFFAGSNK